MTSAASITSVNEANITIDTIVSIPNESSTRRNGRMSALSPGTGLPMVCWLEECRKESVDLVGGKCSSLGELINAGVRVPPGFALTTEGYRRFMADAGINREVQSLLIAAQGWAGGLPGSGGPYRKTQPRPGVPLRLGTGLRLEERPERGCSRL